MVEADPAPGPRIGVRGRLFVGDSSGRHDGVAGCYFHSNRSCRLPPAPPIMEMASSLGMVEADPAPGPRIGVRGRLFVGDSSGRHDGVAGCYFHSNRSCRLPPAPPIMEMGLPVGMAGATPPQVPRGSGRHSALAGCCFHSNGTRAGPPNSWTLNSHCSFPVPSAALHLPRLSRTYRTCVPCVQESLFRLRAKKY